MPAKVWFRHAEQQMSVREMKLHSEHYESVITLLVLRRAATASDAPSDDNVDRS